ncbi:MAG: hypothetical protein AABW67_01680 [Nanoarchaeota archaeon]
MNNYNNLIKAGIFGVSLLVNTNQSQAKPNKPNLETKIIQNEDVNEPNTLSYNLIKEIVVKDFLKNYLYKITPQSETFQKLNTKYGEEGVLEKYCSAHELTLNLAFKYQEKNIPTQEFINLGKQLAQRQYETSKGLSRVNYLDKRVIKSFEKWGEIKTENFKRLLEATKKTATPKILTEENKKNYIKELHNLAYSEEEYEKYVQEQNLVNDNLYDSMKKTLNFIESLVGSKEIEIISKMTRESYEEPLNTHFTKK